MYFSNRRTPTLAMALCLLAMMAQTASAEGHLAAVPRVSESVDDPLAEIDSADVPVEMLPEQDDDVAVATVTLTMDDDDDAMMVNDTEAVLAVEESTEGPSETAETAVPSEEATTME